MIRIMRFHDRQNQPTNWGNGRSSVFDSEEPTNEVPWEWENRQYDRDGSEWIWSEVIHLSRLIFCRSYFELPISIYRYVVAHSRLRTYPRTRDLFAVSYDAIVKQSQYLVREALWQWADQWDTWIGIEICRVGRFTASREIEDAFSRVESNWSQYSDCLSKEKGKCLGRSEWCWGECGRDSWDSWDSWLCRLRALSSSAWEWYVTKTRLHPAQPRGFGVVHVVGWSLLIDRL